MARPDDPTQPIDRPAAAPPGQLLQETLIDRALGLAHEIGPLTGGERTEALAALQAREPELVRLVMMQIELQAGEAPPGKPAPPMLAGNAKRLGRYEITGKLGAGGMGEVLAVTDQELGRTIAAKVILGEAAPWARARFVQEAQLTGQLEHPNIIPVHELGLTPDERVYFTMKRVEGQDLADLLTDGEAEELKIIKLLQIFLKVCHAISFAHSKQVIHRDLKPANIMVGRFGEVQVMDWGLAKLIGNQDEDQTDRARPPSSGKYEAPDLTLEGTVAGTPAYMPPEQAKGQIAQLDERADIYSLGAILYEMLTLSPPYQADTARELLEQVIEGQLTPPSQRAVERDVPWELEAVVHKAMANLREDRYASVVELTDDIEAYLEGRLLTAARYSLGQQLIKWGGRHRLLVGVASAVIVAGVVAFGGIWHQLQKAKTAESKAETAAKAAGKAADKATISAARADSSARDALQTLGDMKGLADATRVRKYEEQAEKLWPPHPHRLPEMDAWLELANELSMRLGRHALMLATLRNERGRPLKGGGWDFKNTEDKWFHNLLADLVKRLKTFKKTSTKSVEERRTFAATIRKRSLEDQAEAWKRAIKAIAQSQKYNGLRLKPQLGLVPLGPDPATGFWEFLHLQTGKAPVRASNNWKIAPETGLVMVLLPGGRFTMGATKAEKKVARKDEKPAHEVTLAPFFMSKYEMTQGQWLELAKNNPALYSHERFKKLKHLTMNHPIENVTWGDCARILRRGGLLFPSEAQWEYAARGGQRTPWLTGSKATGLQGAANLADLAFKLVGGLRNGVPWNDHHSIHAPVGTLRPNRFGLFDVTGNVWEWCGDEYGPYTGRPPQAGNGLRIHRTERRFRVARGGGYDSSVLHARVAYRHRGTQVNKGSSIGVRPALKIR